MGIVAQGGAFYSMFSVGLYTVAPFKVVWPNIGSSIEAAVVGQIDRKPLIPQHTITLVATSSLKEAHYVAACVNSAPFQLAARSYSQTGGKSFGDPHLLKNLRIPTYDPASEECLVLADFSFQAHRSQASSLSENDRQELDRAASRLWGLSDHEADLVRRCEM
jgi:hypothetical protein